MRILYFLFLRLSLRDKIFHHKSLILRLKSIELDSRRPWAGPDRDLSWVKENFCFIGLWINFLVRKTSFSKERFSVRITNKIHLIEIPWICFSVLMLKWVLKFWYHEKVLNRQLHHWLNMIFQSRTGLPKMLILPESVEFFLSNYPANLSEKALFHEKEAKKKNWNFFQKIFFLKEFSLFEKFPAKKIFPLFLLLGKFLCKKIPLFGF